MYLYANVTAQMPPRPAWLTGPAPTYQPFPLPPEQLVVPSPVGPTLTARRFLPTDIFIDPTGKRWRLQLLFHRPYCPGQQAEAT